MANNNKIEVNNGQIKLPYNFNDEKYIIGIERKDNNTLVAGKTIIPIRDSKPSYILEITPKTSPTFHFKKSGDGEYYEIVKNEVIFNVNFIVDDTPLTTSDYEVNIDWFDKYEIIKTNHPKEIVIKLNNDYTKITNESFYYDELENNNFFSDKININIIVNENELVYSAVLEINFQKSYFETISKYDSIDIAKRDNSNDETKKSVITIDGFYNDNKVNREDLQLNLKRGDDIFTTIVDTMDYADIIKEKNEWYLTYKTLSSQNYTRNNTFFNWVVDENSNIYSKINNVKNLIVSGDTLYHENCEKIIDSDGNVYSGSTKLIDNSGNIIVNNKIKIDNNGNILSGNTEIINRENKILYNLEGENVADLGNEYVLSSGSTCQYKYNKGELIIGKPKLTLNIGDDNKNIDCYKSKYDFVNKKLYINDNVLLYDNNNKKLFFKDDVASINIKENVFNVGDQTIISGGSINNISGFTYEINSGVIGNITGGTIVTVVNDYNKNSVTGDTSTKTFFNTGYTRTYYISDANGALNYSSNHKHLLSAQTLYCLTNINSTTGATSNKIIKYDGSGFRLKLIDGLWIKIGSNNNVSGYTSSDDNEPYFCPTGKTIDDKNGILTGFTVPSTALTFWIKKDNEKPTSPNGNNWSIKYSGDTFIYKLINGQEFKINDNNIILKEKTRFSNESIIYNITGQTLEIENNNNKTAFAKLGEDLKYEWISLGGKYYYSNGNILYDSQVFNSEKPHVDLNTLTFNSGDTFAETTQISSGIVKSAQVEIMDLENGYSKLCDNFYYTYNDKKLLFIDKNINNNNVIIDYQEKIITLSGTNDTKIINLEENSIINKNGDILVDESGNITLHGNNNKFNIFDKIINFNDVLEIDFKNNIILKGNLFHPFDINVDINGVTTITSNETVLKIDSSNNKKIEFNNINKYDLIFENNKISITPQQIWNKVNKYEWDNESKNITCNGYVITNKNNERKFYYCDTDGNIYFNKEIVKYVKDDNKTYYNLETGKQVVFKDGDIIIDTTTTSVLPEKNDILDKYNNIKINGDTSYDYKNKLYKDIYDRVNVNPIFGDTYDEKNIFRTTTIDFNNDGRLYDSNGRFISDLFGKKINIEGGLIISDSNIYYEGELVVSAITNENTIGLTENASKYDISLNNDTVYYRNKIAYKVNEGGFYFENKIDEAFNTGFTLSNGLIITPITTQVATINDETIIGSYQNYSNGICIKNQDNDFTIYVTKENDGSLKVSEFNESDENNPGFAIDKNKNLTYKGFTIVSVNDKLLFNPRNPKDLILNNKLINHIYDNENGVLDLSGEIVDCVIEDKNNVYYYAHSINEIKKNIPDLASYMFKQNKSDFDINVEVTYIDVMRDNKSYTLITNGYNNSSYKISVEPQFITQNMINNGSIINAKINNNNGDHIPHSTYSENNYVFKYMFDGSGSENVITSDSINITLSTGTPIFNEIKFSLYCNDNLVNQEVVEVLGENKLIKLTEYVDVTNGSTNYVIQPTVNAYYGTGIVWKNDKQNNITSIDITSTSTTQTISGYCNNVLVYEQTILPLKKGDTGPQGPEGPRGKLLYPAGRWNENIRYDGKDNEKTPFVLYDNKYYVLTANEEIIGNIPGQSSAWTEMQQYEAIYTKLLVAENGIVGGSVYNGDYVFSKNGTFNNKISNEYDKFLNTGLPLVDMIFSGDSEYHYHNTFIPNYLVDFEKGRAWFGNGNTIINENGGIYTNNLIEELNTYYAYNVSNSNLDIEKKWDEKISGINYNYDIYNYDSNNELTGITQGYVTGATAYVKNITGLNSYIEYVYGENEIQQCSHTDNFNLFKLQIKDASITKKNSFYRGSITIGMACPINIIVSFMNYKQPSTDNDENIYENYYYRVYSHNNRELKFIFKWDGGEKDGYKTGLIDFINENDFDTYYIIPDMNS